MKSGPRNIGEQIVALGQQGKSYSEISSALDCSKGTIAYHLGNGQKLKYAESSKAARDRKRKKMKELKSGPCVDCGIAYPYYVMQFDHIGTDKVSDVSKLAQLKAWQTVLDEIAKCELVCSNCHAERTHQRQRSLGKFGNPLGLGPRD